MVSESILVRLRCVCWGERGPSVTGVAGVGETLGGGSRIPHFVTILTKDTNVSVSLGALRSMGTREKISCSN
jgi:hypothetical protein